MEIFYHNKDVNFFQIKAHHEYSNQHSQLNQVGNFVILAANEHTDHKSNLPKHTQ